MTRRPPKKPRASTSNRPPGRGPRRVRRLRRGRAPRHVQSAGRPSSPAVPASEEAVASSSEQSTRSTTDVLHDDLRRDPRLEHRAAEPSTPRRRLRRPPKRLSPRTPSRRAVRRRHRRGGLRRSDRSEHRAVRPFDSWRRPVMASEEALTVEAPSRRSVRRPGPSTSSSGEDLATGTGPSASTSGVATKALRRGTSPRAPSRRPHSMPGSLHDALRRGPRFDLRAIERRRREPRRDDLRRGRHEELREADPAAHEARADQRAHVPRPGSGAAETAPAASAVRRTPGLTEASRRMLPDASLHRERWDPVGRPRRASGRSRLRSADESSDEPRTHGHPKSRQTRLREDRKDLPGTRLAPGTHQRDLTLGAYGLATARTGDPGPRTHDTGDGRASTSVPWLGTPEGILHPKPRPHGTRCGCTRHPKPRPDPAPLARRRTSAWSRPALPLTPHARRLGSPVDEHDARTVRPKAHDSTPSSPR